MLKLEVNSLLSSPVHEAYVIPGSLGKRALRKEAPAPTSTRSGSGRTGVPTQEVALAGAARWLGVDLCTERSPVPFPVRARARFQALSRVGGVQEAAHGRFFLPFPSSLFKINLKKMQEVSTFSIPKQNCPSFKGTDFPTML